MADVCQKNNIPFVDLLHPTLAAYAKASSPLTINGIHLNDNGNEVVGRLIDRVLFGKVAAGAR